MFNWSLKLVLVHPLNILKISINIYTCSTNCLGRTLPNAITTSNTRVTVTKTKYGHTKTTLQCLNPSLSFNSSPPNHQTTP